MDSVDLDEVADRLYGLPPEEFTTARDAAAKAAPDKDLRAAVKTLRRPTAAAYAVNVLARERTGDVDALLAIGDALRRAMGRDADQVRHLSEQRRSLVTALVDRTLPANVQQDVTATLEAATADPALGAAVRSGRLVKPLRYAGFGALPDLDDAVATPPPATAPPATQRRKQPPTEPARSKPDLAPLRQRVLDLAGAADDAQRRYELAARTAEEARGLADRAEAEAAAALTAARTAHDEAEQARQELGRRERS
jgi:hypothetical protein